METRPPLVLCVDDNQDVADSAGELLRLVGFNARVCYDGPIGAGTGAELPPGRVPPRPEHARHGGRRTGRAAAQQAAGRPVLFVAVTAMGSEECRRRTAAAGFDLHLLKPVDPHDLLRVVDELWRVSAQPALPIRAVGGE